MATDTTTVEAKLKAKLLDNYAEKTPNFFLQFDAWSNVEEGDFVFVPDPEGDCLFYSETFELMTSRPHIRVLIDNGPRKGALTSPATKEDLLRLLDKIKAAVADQEDFTPPTEAEANELAEEYATALGGMFSRLDTGQSGQESA